MEVTTWTEALRCKRAAVGRLSERAGRSVSERRASLEIVNAAASPSGGREGSSTSRWDSLRPQRHTGEGDRDRRGHPSLRHSSNIEVPAWAGRVAERPVVPGKPGNAGGGNGPQFERNAGKKARIMETGASLAASDTVRKLRTALHAQAKGSPAFRFYTLSDKVWRQDVLEAARQAARRNGRTCGVDGETVAAVEERGPERWLGELARELREDSYRLRAVRQVLIPKKQPGQFRPLGIPCLRDRVAQTAAMLVLSPIFEADLQLEQYAYRAGRSALDAVQRVHRLVNKGHREIVDGDLSNYFGGDSARGTAATGARHVSDGRLPGWIKAWLEMAVVEDDGKGGQRRTNRARRERKGTPQGAPISPLLSNVYMRQFILGWKTLGHARRFGAEIVNYADDFVICGQAPAAAKRATVERMMERLRLPLNAMKTRSLRVPEEPLEFLGYRVGRNYRKDTGREYIGTRPSAGSVRSICHKISALSEARYELLPAPEVAEHLNRVLLGWANYFRLGQGEPGLPGVDAEARKRLRRGCVGSTR